jgi:TonB family protein
MQNGKEFQSKHAYKKAYDCFYKGLQSDPANLSIREALLNAGQAEVKESSGSPDALIDLGDAYACSGRMEAAHAAFKKALQLSPNRKNSQATWFLRLLASETSGGKKPSAAEWLKVTEVDFGPFMADMQRRIKHAWSPPKGEESKPIVVIFTVHQNGDLTDAKVEKSAGSKLAEQAALKAIHDASPVGKLPDGSTDTVSIQFNLGVH